MEHSRMVQLAVPVFVIVSLFSPLAHGVDHRAPTQSGTLLPVTPLIQQRFEPQPTPASSWVATANAAKQGAVNQHRALPHVQGETDPSGTAPAVYLVQFIEPPVAMYTGGVAGLAPTSSGATGARRLDSRSADAQRYRAYLGERRTEFLRRAEALVGQSLHVLYAYDTAFNGLAVQMTPQEAARVVPMQGVSAVTRDRLRHKLTNDSPAFLGVPGIWDGSATGGLPGTKGEGIIVGVIDTGVWPEHPSFADDGSFPPPPARWAGSCSDPADGSRPYTCSNKLIGVQYFLEGYVAYFGSYNGLFYSGRDDDGHGTHTASTAAGNENVPAVIYGVDRGLVSGMAPRAHVAAYKGLGPTGGMYSDLVAAIDKAVADGVDVINYSVGGQPSDPWIVPDALAYLAAREAGIFVAAGAGNSGPFQRSILSPADAPWVTGVGASYFNRLYLSDITLNGPGAPPTGLFGATTTPGVADFNLVNAKGVPDSRGSTDGLCGYPFLPGTFQPTDAVLCQKIGVPAFAIGNMVAAGGAGAVVLYNVDFTYDIGSYLHPIPTVVVYNAAGLAIRDYLAANPGAVTISFTQGNKVYAPDLRVPVDTVTGFSSRGPVFNGSNSKPANYLKPDVTAPGIHVLAGASPEHVTEICFFGCSGPYGAQGETFRVIQGTSMSSPHVAGAGALLAALHPDLDAGRDPVGPHGDSAHRPQSAHPWW